MFISVHYSRFAIIKKNLLSLKHLDVGTINMFRLGSVSGSVQIETPSVSCEIRVSRKSSAAQHTRRRRLWFD